VPKNGVVSATSWLVSRICASLASSRVRLVNVRNPDCHGILIDVRATAPVFETVNATPPDADEIVNENRVTLPTTVGATSVQVPPLRRQNLSGTSPELQNSQVVLPPVAAVTVSTYEAVAVPTPVAVPLTVAV
jgi:hypothetical protein